MARTRLLQVKVTEEEETLIRSAAKAQGISAAALLRAAVLAYVGAPGSGPSLAGRVRALEIQERQLRAQVVDLTRQVRTLIGRAVAGEKIAP